MNILQKLNHDLRGLSSRSDIEILPGSVDGFLTPERNYHVIRAKAGDATKRIRCEWRPIGDADTKLDVLHLNQAARILQDVVKAFK